MICSRIVEYKKKRVWIHYRYIIRYDEKGHVIRKAAISLELKMPKAMKSYVFHVNYMEVQQLQLRTVYQKVFK